MVPPTLSKVWQLALECVLQQLKPHTLERGKRDGGTKRDGWREGGMRHGTWDVCVYLRMLRRKTSRIMRAWMERETVRGVREGGKGFFQHISSL